MGALNSLLDAKDDAQTRKTNTKEMAFVVAEALSDLSKKQNGQEGKVIFIIDDTQWMDDESYEMLKLLFEALKEFKDNQVSFILTSRPVSEDDKVKKLISELENIKDVNVYRGINGQILENDEIVEGILDNLKFDYRTKQSLAEFFRKKRIQRPLHILQTIETLIEREMIEPFSDRFVLSKNTNLKKLPPPDDFKSMVKEELCWLDQRIISVLQCCAVMGRSFRVSIIASIFNLDLLELLELFKDAEERGIIRDVAQEDDTYEFSEKRMVGIFRELKSSQMEEEHISQKVREYHKRFVNEAEKEINDEIDSAPYRAILSLASHSHAIRDAFPEKAFYYSRIAAEKTYARGMFNAANRFYKNAFEIINADKAKVAIEETLKFYISYAKCLLDEQCDNQIISECINKAHELLNAKVPIANGEWAMMEISLIEALNNYRNRRFEDAIDSSNSVLKNGKASLIQKSRAMFYRAASLPREEGEKRKTAHLEVIAETENILKTSEIPDTDRVEILKVKSEALNNTGFIFLSGLNSPDEALEYFELAIKINALPEINDQKGVAIAHGGRGDCFKSLNQLDKAEKEYEINLNISQKTGDSQGICRMTSALGAIKIEKGKNSEDENRKKLLDEAEKLYERSLATAEIQKNAAGICFALSGLLETILVSGSYERTEYVFSRLEVIRKKFDPLKIPDFAKEALTKSLKKISKIMPKYKDLIKAYGSEL
jgi:tetratricopeptide (TPR) repeat protein